MCSVAVQFSDVIENRERFMAKSWERAREGGMGAHGSQPDPSLLPRQMPPQPYVLPSLSLWKLFFLATQNGRLALDGRAS